MSVLRRFLRRAMHGPKGYIENQVIRSTGIHSDPTASKPLERTSFDFNDLLGRLEYQLKTRELFDQLDVPWLPACELFAPWYSYALAKYILEQQISPDGTVRPLRIVELGGRGGNTALHILDCLKYNSLELYNATEYTCVSPSERTSQLQRQMVSQRHPVSSATTPDSRTFKAVTADLIADYDAALESSSGSDDYGAVAAQVVAEALPQDRLNSDVLVLALDVFDNLGHDKVEMTSDGEWQETVLDDQDPPVEHLRPLSDPMIARALKVFATTRCPHSVFDRSKGDGLFDALFPFTVPHKYRLDGDRRAAFVPTEALMLFDLLHFGLGPGHRLVSSGFDFLPQAKLPILTRLRGQHDWMKAYNPPLVTNGKKDFNSYLLSFEEFEKIDVYFASDFDSLAAAYSSASTTASCAVKTYRGSEFLSEYAELKETAVLGGYNPLVEDCSNYQFLIRETV